MRTRKLDEDFL